jgi:hypothetical protein
MFTRLLRITISISLLVLVAILGTGMEHYGWHVPSYVFMQLAVVSFVMSIWNFITLKTGSSSREPDEDSLLSEKGD